jgi:integrase
MAATIVAATMGLRRGELLGLRWVDLDLAKGTLRIEKTVQRAGGKLHIQDAKTESSESVLPLPEITRRTLEEHRELQAKERTTLWARLGSNQRPPACKFDPLRPALCAFVLGGRSSPVLVSARITAVRLRCCQCCCQERARRAWTASNLRLLGAGRWQGPAVL